MSQYRHPTRSPLAYWRAALERDPGDVRTNLALADRDYRAGDYQRALERAERALDRLTCRNANPVDAEAFYLLGLILRRLGRVTEAEHAFGKAGWDGTWAAGAGFALARSLTSRGRSRAALRVLDTLDGVVGHDTRRVALRAILLRRAGRAGDAELLLKQALELDPLDATLRALAGRGVSEDAGLLLDVAVDLRDAGEFVDALALLREAGQAPITASGNVRPIAHYLAADIFDRLGEPTHAHEERLAARKSDLTWAFPYGLDALDALERAIAADPGDAVANSLIGMLLYAHGRLDDATAHWNRAVELGGSGAILLRNAALAAYNVSHDDDRAWALYERATEAAPQDARVRFEQDQLALRLGHDSAERLARLRPLRDLVLTRDDFTIEFIKLLVSEGEAAEAHRILTDRPFHPWEGGEGQAIAAWDETLRALGLPLADPPASLGEARAQYVAPLARHEDGATDYFATSLPELLLFSRELNEE